MNDALRAIARVVAAGRPPKIYAVFAVVTLAAASALGALPPIFTGRIIDALGHADAKTTFVQLAWYAGITIAASAIGFANSYATSAFRETVTSSLRTELMRKLLHARMSEIESLTFGEIANRLNEEVDTLSYRFEYMLFPCISSVFVLTATVATMFAIDVRFAALCCAAVLLSLVPARRCARRFKDVTQSEAANHDERTSTVCETATLGALALLRHPRAADRHLRRYAGINDAGRRLRLHIAMIAGVSGFSTTLLNLVGPVCVLALGAVLLVHHAGSVGTIVTFLMYQSRLYAPFSSLASLPMQLSGCAVSAGRILEIFDLRDERSGNATFARGTLGIDDVVVRKDGRDILRGARTRIGDGEHVAIVGPSGAGKSTIALLVLRLADPESGALRIGANDLRDVEIGELRESIALVAQDALIFDASARENLICLRPDAPLHDIESAVDLCRLREVIARLPGGYDTVLGQRGFRLSGGERQRLCLARAVIAEPHVMILDEALTGVDVEMERRILADLRAARAGATMLVVTHRLQHAGTFDRVIVVEEGSIVADGSHADALRASAWYRSAYARTHHVDEPLAV